MWRGELTFVVLNAYPYATGHLLVMPVRHVGALGDLTDAEGAELWTALRRAVATLEAAYDPDGVNLGANLGGRPGPASPGTSISTCCPAGRGTPTS